MIKQLLFVALLATTAHFMLNSAPAEKPTASNNPFRVSFPVVGKMQTAHGNQRIPFYMDSGVQNLVTAEISRTAAEAMLKRGNGQYDYQPVLTRDGKAIVTLWIMKYGMTTCGAYQEVVVTLSVCQLNSPLYCDADYSAESGAPEDLVAATLAPGVHNFADWLYLDQPLPISYGRDIFGTRKHQVPMESQYDDREDGSAEFRATPELQLWRNMLIRQPAEGYAGCSSAIAGTDFYTTTASLRLPALGIAGSEDGSTPPDLVRETIELIPGSRFHLIRGAGHLPCVENPEEYANVLKSFLHEIGHI